MTKIYLIICCSTLIYCVLPLKHRNTCINTDFFYCYYSKECQPFCPGDENFAINTRYWKSTQLEKNNNIQEMASESGQNGFYRPRSALARALYDKQRNDRNLQEIDQNEWYQVYKNRLTEELQNKFVQLHPDEETKQFLSQSIDKSQWVWTQVWYLLAKAVLRHFWSITDINGWLGRGSMFVLSEDHARALLSAAGRAPTGAGSLVDVGAGDGEVSRRFASLYSLKYATEISDSMRKALSTKGYTLLDTEEWWRDRQFDCVCMLNLLDRCSRPRSMLQQAKSALAPGGLLVLALVLPYKPYVEVNADHKPEERLPISGHYFEEQVASFVQFMSKEGFELAAWARAPYLCEGDFAQAYYWLDDSVYVFRPAPISTHT